MNDLVSIIMPSYNTEQYIAETIQSVINQTYQNWELIIVDDCSTDNTDTVVGKIKDSRIRYLKNEKNSGAAVSRNKALREANGRWVAFLDSDDLWKPEKLEKQISFMMKKKCVVVMIAVGIAVITGGICTAVCVIRRKRKGT